MGAILLFAACPDAAAQARAGPLEPQAAAHSGKDEDTESIKHTFIVGVGGAGELELADGSIHPGANVMLEWDAIEDWLEPEIGASILAIDGAAEVPIDLLSPFGSAAGPSS